MEKTKQIELLEIKTYEDFKFASQVIDTLPKNFVLDITFRILDWILAGNSIEDDYVKNLFSNFRIYANKHLDTNEIEMINNILRDRK